MDQIIEIFIENLTDNVHIILGKHMYNKNKVYRILITERQYKWLLEQNLISVRLISAQNLKTKKLLFPTQALLTAPTSIEEFVEQLGDFEVVDRTETIDPAHIVEDCSMEYVPDASQDAITEHSKGTESPEAPATSNDTTEIVEAPEGSQSVTEDVESEHQEEIIDTPPATEPVGEEKPLDSAADLPEVKTKREYHRGTPEEIAAKKAAKAAKETVKAE